MSQTLSWSFHLSAQLVAADVLGKVAAPIARRVQRVVVNCIIVGVGVSVIEEDVLVFCWKGVRVWMWVMALSFGDSLKGARQSNE